MDLVTFLTVENKVKFDDHEWFPIDNPSQWLWASINNVWQPIIELETNK